MMDIFRGHSQAPPQGAPESLGSPTFSTLSTTSSHVTSTSSASYPSFTSSISSTISGAELCSQLGNNPDVYTVIAPDLISKYEMNFWYHGISGDPPKLMWRSDFETNPFPIPAPGAHFFNIPTKTAHGVFNTPLNTVWDTVAPLILASIKAHGLKYSALKTVRFSTVDGNQKETFGPVTVWIAVCPKTTNARAVCDATPAILHILAESHITDIVVEWYEGVIQRLGGPPLMSVEGNTSPKFGLNHPFNAGLGIPIARQSDDAQGTLTFLFREMKTSDGDPSDRTLALTCKHVVTLDKFDKTNPQHILVCGNRRYNDALTDVENAIDVGDRKALRLSRELNTLTSKQDEETSSALERKTVALKYAKNDNVILHELFVELMDNWKDPDNRRLGLVDWAPEISVSVDDYHYTRDIATIAVNGTKLKNFEHNIIDLGVFRFVPPFIYSKIF
jgi:hypothetical protein